MKTTYTENGDTKTEDLDQYGDAIKTASKIKDTPLIGNTQVGDSIECIRQYGMILAFTKTINSASIEIEACRARIEILESKE